MGTRTKSNIPKKSEELADNERELFLNAVFQGQISLQEKYVAKKEKHRVEKYPRKSDDGTLDNEERALFLTAVEYGLDAIHRKIEQDFEPTPEQRKQARKRDSVDAELDLHGLYVEDAIAQLLRFMDHEYRRGSRTILVVHGKGSGALKKAVWSVIETHPHVNDYQVAPGKLGGAGSILVRINRGIKRK